jgi:ferritin-like metal-binding protein YciE
MTDQRLQEKLGDYIEDAHAMETNVLQMLDSMIATTTDPKIRDELERHKGQTEQHQERLRERLEAIGRDTSTRHEAQTLVGALMKGVVDQVGGDKPGKNARDGFITEHMEIASYELLERLAERAGDGETAKVARTNRRDEEAMAKKIAGKWDKFVDLTLEEEGIDAPKPRRTASRTRSTTSTSRKRSTSRSRKTATRRR